MRYFFNGKIEKQDNFFSIRIPFNVWEVCKQRDVIPADLVLDNKIIACELLPEEKGIYKIHRLSLIEVGIFLIFYSLCRNVCRMKFQNGHRLLSGKFLCCFCAFC